MYNTWFGDCFRLYNHKINLFVDFGIHQGCLSGGIPVVKNNYSSSCKVSRDDVHNKISCEIAAFDEKPNLLLTHYHLDHFSGLTFMKSKICKSPIFDTIYLPDIWSISDSTNIIAVLVLEALMENCKLSKSGCSLLELVRFLCKDVENVCLLRRGNTFENDNFIALWPDVNLISKLAKKLLPKDDLDWLQKITGFSEKLRKIVSSLTEQKQDFASKEIHLLQIESLIEEFDSLYEYDKIQKLIDQNKEIELNKFGNDLSIVFQNRVSNDNNMLFTGDLGTKYLKRIDINKDGVVSMYKRYCYIKIPHHGTKGSSGSLHYYDFSKYAPNILMIPNGKCHSSSYKISRKYGCDIANIAKTGTLKVYCSNSNWCDMNLTGILGDCTCGASSTQIIFPEISMKIT